MKSNSTIKGLIVIAGAMEMLAFIVMSFTIDILKSLGLLGTIVFSIVVGGFVGAGLWATFRLVQKRWPIFIQGRNVRSLQPAQMMLLGAFILLGVWVFQWTAFSLVKSDWAILKFTLIFFSGFAPLMLMNRLMANLPHLKPRAAVEENGRQAEIVISRVEVSGAVIVGIFEVVFCAFQLYGIPAVYDLLVATGVRAAPVFFAVGSLSWFAAGAFAAVITAFLATAFEKIKSDDLKFFKIEPWQRNPVGSAQNAA